MLASTLLLAAAMAQTQVAQTDCAAAMARGMSAATTQICLAETELARGESAQKDGQEWRRHVEAAATLYKRSLGLPADEVIKSTAIERLLRIFDVPMLNNQAEMLAAFGELIALRPTDVEPLFRLAKYQESQVSPDAAEETLLSARRLQPTEIKTFQTSRAVLRTPRGRHARQRAEAGRAGTNRSGIARQERRLPGRRGHYPSRRFGNAVYPAEAMAANIDGVVTAEITVNEQGVVADARVLNSNPVLDEAALKAVREWRYDPTMVDGKAVPVKMTVTVNFSLRR